MDKHKTVLAIGGGALAGLMLLNFIFGHYTGDYKTDFDLSDILNALTGKLNPVAFLTSSSGIKLLISLFIGIVIPNFGLYSLFSKSTKILNNWGFKIVMGLLTTPSARMKIKLNKGTTTNSEMMSLQKESFFNSDKSAKDWLKEQICQ